MEVVVPYTLHISGYPYLDFLLRVCDLYSILLDSGHQNILHCIERITFVFLRIHFSKNKKKEGQNKLVF